MAAIFVGVNPDIIRLRMNPRRSLFVFLLVMPLLFLGMRMPAGASPVLQVQYATPTAGPDGRIIYIVQPGDTCTRISLLNGISIDQLLQLNPQLDENCLLQVGAELMLGIGGPAVVSPSPGPAPTSEPATVTPTPPAGTTEICVLLYEDLNGDALRQETELGIAGGAVSVSNTAGTYSDTQTTVSAIDPDTEEPQQICFVDVPEGEYNISIAVPDNYNPTMEITNTFTIKAGDRAFVDFGAQSTEFTANQTEPENGGDRSNSPVLGILGGLLLIGGLGLAWYAFRSRKPASRMRGGRLLRR
jgi:hypothetical protein